MNHIKNSFETITGHMSGKAHDLAASAVAALPMVNIETHYPTVLVTLAFALSLNLIDAVSVGVGRSAFKVGYPTNAQQGPTLLKHAARAHQNQLEQGLPFLAILWCTSLYGPSANFAAFFGSLWLVMRVLYANAYRRNVNVSQQTLRSKTYPSYWCLLIMAFATLHKILTRQFFAGNSFEAGVCTAVIAVLTVLLAGGNAFILRSLYSGGTMSDISEKIKDKAFQAKEGIQEQAYAAKDYMQEKATAVKETVQDKAYAAKETMQDKAYAAKETVQDKAYAAKEGVQEKTQTVKEGAKEKGRVAKGKLETSTDPAMSTVPTQASPVGRDYNVVEEGGQYRHLY
jgi:uncharacterized MAPEG superfamily protein